MEILTLNHDENTQKCKQHKKVLNVLLPSSAIYICQDCAIFDPLYKNYQKVCKNDVHIKVQKLRQNYQKIIKGVKETQNFAHNSLREIVQKIDEMNQSLVNIISFKFQKIKIELSRNFLNKIQENMISPESIRQIEQILKKTKSQEIIKFYMNSQLELNHNSLKQQSQIQEIKTKFLEQIQNSLRINVDFDQIYKKIDKQINLLNKAQGRIEDQIEIDLLDFSDFKLEFEDKFYQKSNCKILQKERKLQRIKTAACLQYSDSQTQNSQLFNNHQNQQFLLPIQIINKTKYLQNANNSGQISARSTKKSSQNTIQIQYATELDKKLMRISPSIRIIKMNSLGLNTFDALKQVKKTSQSFVQTIQLTSNKITQKFLQEIKNFKPKNLKKIILKGNPIKFEDKKTKQLLKRIEKEGVQVIF